MKNLKDNPRIRALCLAVLFFGLLAFEACARQDDLAGKEGALDEVEAITSGKLAAIGGKGAKTIYISVHDTTGKMLDLPADAKKSLAAKGFDLEDSPSKAAWILQVTVLGEGSVSLEDLRKMVAEGYGEKAKFVGRGTTGLLADVLLVNRRVPTSRRPSRERLKNIGRSNAIGSSQMRIALYVPHETPRHDKMPAYFSDGLAREILTALSSRRNVAEAE